MSLQQRDTLIYNSVSYKVDRDVLKPYFEVYPERRPEKQWFDSNLHRGYFAELCVKDDQLHVLDVRVYVSFDQQKQEPISMSILDSVLPKSLVCNWFKGMLSMFRDDLSHAGSSQFLLMEFEFGKLKDVKEISQQEYLELQDHGYDYL